MHDSRSSKRKYLASVERNKMIARYSIECVDKPVRFETEEEKRIRLLNKWAKEKCRQTWQLHYIREEDSDEENKSEFTNN